MGAYLQFRQHTLPSADQIEKLDKKNPISYIYIGKPSRNYQDTYGTADRIQLNDKYASVENVKAFISSERGALREELRPRLTMAMKVDSDANMGIVSDVKQVLRDENALKINYTTRKGDAVSKICYRKTSFFYLICTLTIKL